MENKNKRSNSASPFFASRGQLLCLTLFFLFFFPLQASARPQTRSPITSAQTLSPPYQFRELPRLPFPPPPVQGNLYWGAFESATGDVDGDGIADLFVANAGNPLDYFKNLGNGRFKKANKIAWPPYQKKLRNNAERIVLGDIDGDGDLDAVAGFHYRRAYNATASVRIYLNDGKGNFVDVSSQFLPKKNLRLNIQDLILVDVDGDKDLDLVFALAGTIYDTTPALYLNDGKGKFTDASGPLPFSSWTLSVQAKDIDGDKDLDLVFGTWATKNLVLFINDGKGGFSNQSLQRLPSDRSDSPIFALGDVDGDRDIDIAISQGAALKIYENNGKGYFSLSKKTFFKKTFKWGTTNVLFLDPDQDGDLDLLVSGMSNYPNKNIFVYNLWYYENNGKGVYRQLNDKVIPFWMWHQPNVISTFDLDEDGDQDLLYLSGNPAPTYHHIIFNTYHQLYAPRPPQRGSTYTLKIFGRPTEATRLYASFARKHIPLGRLGVFGLDPTTSVPLSKWLRLPPKGPVVFNFDIPNIPSLKGWELSTQAFHLDWKKPSRSRFGNVMSDIIR